jgi:arabinose-5-phosphate isomerase
MVNGLLKTRSEITVSPSRMTTITSIKHSIRRAITIEADGMKALLAALDGSLQDSIATAVETIRSAESRVIVTGMGKSGHIGRKIAATLASTGTPASFVHPAEASHGDLGMITPRNVVLMLSNSGESAELKDLLNYCARFSVPMIAITANAASTMGRAADVTIQIPKVEEACPNGLAPTTSTLLQLAIGDAIAMALLDAKGFSAEDFRNFHPGGKLGAQIKHARDIMHGKSDLPLVEATDTLLTAISKINEKRFGCVGVIDHDGKLAGIITDGDVRRNIAREIKSLRAADVMTKAPTTVNSAMLAAEVIEIINSKRITAVFVVDAAGKPEGLIHIHDLLREGVS